MKRSFSLISIDKPWEDCYYLGIGLGFENDSDGFFIGLVIAFIYWNIRIGLDIKD